ncbi:MAG TPA: DMT family transporter [Polyangia bacterium]|nr:DMT family transporter [Polyangia bacterium]
MIGGIVLGLGASACWAIANVAVQRSARLVGTFRGLLWAQLVGIVLVVAALPFDVRTAAPTLGLAPWIFVAGAGSLLAYLCLFYAFEHGRLTIAVPVMSSWAVLASAISLVLFHERVRAAQLGGAALVVLGAVVVSRFAQASGGAAAGSKRWLLASFGAAIGFGVSIPVIGVLAPATGRLGVIAVVYAADILLGLPLAARYRVSLSPPSGARAWIAVALAGFFEAAGFACIAFAARFAPLALVSPLSSQASTFTVLFAWLALRERPAKPVLLGAALVAGGVIILSL